MKHPFQDPKFPKDILYKMMLIEIVIAYAPEDIIKQMEILEGALQDLKDAWNDEVIGDEL